MRTFVALLFLALAPALQAQPIPVLPNTSVQPDRTPLAEAADVPFALLLGLDGATPLFVNPARAAHSKHRLVYGTVQPTYTPGAVSFVSLLGNRKARWLIVADNNVRDQNEETSDVSTLEADASQSLGITSIRTSDRTDIRSFEDLSTRGRVLRVGRTDFGGYAFGLFGGYGRSAFSVESQTERTFQQISTSPITEIVESDEQEVFENTTARTAYGAGVELALAGKRWDLAAAAAYQGSENLSLYLEDEVRVAETERTFTPTDRSVSLSEVEREVEARGEDDQQGFTAEVLGTLRAGTSRDDYLFASASGALLSGTGTYVQSLFERRLDRFDDNGTITEQVTGDERDSAGDADLDTQALRLSLGYVYARKSRGALVLAGIIPTAEFARIESLSASRFDVSRRTTDARVLGLELPLHVKLQVKKRLALFGGGVYAYQHFDTERITESLAEEGLSDVRRSDRSRVFLSDGRLYGGATLALRSGLTAQAAFRGDLANFERWTVSLGYRF